MLVFFALVSEGGLSSVILPPLIIQCGQLGVEFLVLLAHIDLRGFSETNRPTAFNWLTNSASSFS